MTESARLRMREQKMWTKKVNVFLMSWWWQLSNTDFIFYTTVAVAESAEVAEKLVYSIVWHMFPDHYPLSWYLVDSLFFTAIVYIVFSIRNGTLC